MANIPLANIPNAPQTGNTAVPTDPSAIRAPNFLRGGAMVVEGMQMLRQKPLPAASFDTGGMGAGLESLGNSGANAAAAFGDFAVRLGRANDEAQMAEMDGIKTDIVSRFEEKALTTPADKLPELWQKFDAEFADRASKLPMSSPLANSKRDMAINSTRSQLAAQVRGQSYKKTVENYQQSVENLATRALNEGRPEDAIAAYKRGAHAGLFSDEEAEAKIVGIEEQSKVEAWRGYIQQNPAEARKVLRDAQASGTPPKGLRKEQMAQFRREAEGQHGQLLQDVTDGILNGLETNSAQISNDDIETSLTDPRIDAPRELIDKIKERRDFAYAATPEGKAEKDTAYSNLWQRIFAYDAANDVSMSDPDSHKREYQKLLQDIVDVAPEGERKPFMDTLNERVSNAVQGRKEQANEIAKGLTDLTEKLANWEQLGPIGKWKEVKQGDKTEKVPTDIAAYQKVQAKRIEITNDIRQMVRENPDITPEQAMERFKGILENRLDGGALFMQQPDEESWWKKLVPFVQGPMANNPNVMTAGLSWGPLTEGLIDENLPPVASSAPPVSTSFDITNMPTEKQPIASKIASMAEQEGLGQYAPHLMLLVAQESNFDPTVTMKSSSARGLFQLLNDDRERYGSDSSIDGQIRAGLAKTKENIAAAKRALGRDPDPFELYVVHYQGIGAGPAILKNPDGNFRATLDATGGKGHAARVMRANSWLSGIETNQDFIDWVRQRLSAKAASLGLA